jgi:hypothetical protein
MRGFVVFAQLGGVPFAVDRLLAFSTESHILQSDGTLTVHGVEVLALMYNKYSLFIPEQHELCDALMPFHPESVTTHLAGTTAQTPQVNGSVDKTPSLAELLGGKDWLVLGGRDSLGGIDSLGGVSPQWQHPSNIRRSLTMLNRPDNQPRIVAIRRRSFQPCHMCQRQR